MGLLRAGASALGKLIAVVVLGAAFLTGMVSVVYMSLRGEEVKVPEIIGKDVNESEKELASLGLKLKKRANRYSEEKPNTVLEQLPRSGDTVKTGQTILVVVAQANPESTEAPATVKKDDEVEDVNTNTDKPKASSKANTGKKPEKTRDVITNKNKNANASNSNTGSGSNNSKSASNDGGETKNSPPPAANKPAPAAPSKSPAAKPNNKPGATDGDTRNRRAQ